MLMIKFIRSMIIVLSIMSLLFFVVFRYLEYSYINPCETKLISIYERLPIEYKDIKKSITYKDLYKKIDTIETRTIDLDLFSEFISKALVSYYSHLDKTVPYIFYSRITSSILRGENYHMHGHKNYAIDKVLYTIALMKMDISKMFALYGYYAKVDENGKFVNYP